MPKSPRATFRNQNDLVNYLWSSRVITHKPVVVAMKAVDRIDFAPTLPYQDSPQSIGFNATISAPHMHAHALNDLFYNLQPGMKALDIGAGSGYLVTAMANLVGKQGKVIGIEHIRELCQLAVNNIKKHNSYLFDNKTIQILCGDGRNGYPPEAPYDAIHVGAAAPVEVVGRLLKQLKPGGKMVIPVTMNSGRQVFREYTKDKYGKSSFKDKVPVRYVPLTSEKSQRER